MMIKIASIKTVPHARFEHLRTWTSWLASNSNKPPTLPAVRCCMLLNYCIRFGWGVCILAIRHVCMWTPSELCSGIHNLPLSAFVVDISNKYISILYFWAVFSRSAWCAFVGGLKDESKTPTRNLLNTTWDILYVFVVSVANSLPFIEVIISNLSTRRIRPQLLGFQNIVSASVAEALETIVSTRLNVIWFFRLMSCFDTNLVTTYLELAGAKYLLVRRWSSSPQNFLRLLPPLSTPESLLL